MIQLFNYIERVSPIHRLTGASKMACMLCWVLAAMITFDTRYLILLTVFALILFQVSKIRVSDVKVILIFSLVFLVMIYAVIPFDEIGLPIPTLSWWFPELSGLFFVGGAVIGLACGLGEEKTAEAFVAGASELVGVALIIGISRGITVLMDGGQITDTVLYWGERALEGTGSVAFLVLVYLIYLPLSILIPSSSGLATLSVPIVAPLGQFAGIGGSLIVTAFQSASGLVNIVTPTAAVVMGGLAVGGVPYDRWVRFVWKLVLIFFLLTGVFLAVSAIL